MATNSTSTFRATTDPSDALLGGVFARGAAAAAVADRPLLQALLDVEVAHARARASLGLIEPGVADEVRATLLPPLLATAAAVERDLAAATPPAR
jgi:3-carboxy-cis,cis-muconate cycloisomerase